MKMRHEKLKLKPCKYYIMVFDDECTFCKHRHECKNKEGKKE